MTIFLTIFIYLRTGRQIYLKYKTLRSFNSQSRAPEPLIITEPFSTKTTEVYVTSEIMSASVGADTLGHRASAAIGAPQAAYTVEITSDGNALRQTTTAHSHADDADEENGVKIRPVSFAIDSKLNLPSSPISPMSPHQTNSTIAVIPGRAITDTSKRMTSEKVRRDRQKLAVYEANNAAWSYTKCALLFFTALLITWVPSTANRVYSVVHQKQIILGLEYASAFVLPLQGFWNGLIYIFTTRTACKKLIEDIMYYFSTKDSVRLKHSRRNLFTEDRHNSWTGPDRQTGRDRSSYMMSSVLGSGKGVARIPMEAYERI